MKKDNPKEKKTALVKVSPSVRDRVAKKVIGTKDTIGSYYDKAALKELYGINKK